MRRSPGREQPGVALAPRQSYPYILAVFVAQCARDAEADRLDPDNQPGALEAEQRATDGDMLGVIAKATAIGVGRNLISVASDCVRRREVLYFRIACPCSLAPLNRGKRGALNGSKPLAHPPQCLP
jgi:hypothetical protein